MALQGTDLAILSARLGVARLGASRLGFYPDEVEGSGKVEPGAYIWRENKPPKTQWTLVTSCSPGYCTQHWEIEAEPAEATASIPVPDVTVVPVNLTSIAGTIYCQDMGDAPVVGSVMKLYITDSGANWVLQDTQVSGADGTYLFSEIVPPYLDEGKYLCYIEYSKAGGGLPTSNTGTFYCDDGEATIGVDIPVNCLS